MPGKKAPEATRREQIVEAAYAVAARTGVEGLTVRAVAEQAGLSHGLVHFHFKGRDQLVSALLDRVLAVTSVLQVAGDVAAIPGTLDRFHALLRREMDRLSQRPPDVRLFLEFWALGTRDPAIRARIVAALERYRAAFRAVTLDVLRAEPAAFAGVTPDGLAAVAVSFVNGCAVQAMIDPDHFNIAEYLAAVQGIIGRLSAAPSR